MSVTAMRFPALSRPAPDIMAGLGQSKTAMILSAAMMLDWLAGRTATTVPPRPPQAIRTGRRSRLRDWSQTMRNSAAATAPRGGKAVLEALRPGARAPLLPTQ